MYSKNNKWVSKCDALLNHIKLVNNLKYSYSTNMNLKSLKYIFKWSFNR